MPQSSSSFFPAASTRYFEPVTVPAAPKNVSLAINALPDTAERRYSIRPPKQNGWLLRRKRLAASLNRLSLGVLMCRLFPSLTVLFLVATCACAGAASPQPGARVVHVFVALPISA